MFRICKAFTIESGHMLSKHAERCRFPHGHSRRIELVLASPTLDDGDMVCDFKWVKLAVAEYLDAFDHALCVNAEDPFLERHEGDAGRLIIFDEGDPTTELMAKRIYEHVAGCIRRREEFVTPDGVRYGIRPDVMVERVRVGETPSSWAEYAPPNTWHGGASGRIDS